MTGGTEREIRGRTTRTKGSPGQVVDRAGDSGLCRVWVGAVVKLRPRVFQHDETTCVLRFQQGKGGTWEIRCQFIILRGNPVSVRGNPVSVHHSQGKSGVSSSFSGEIRCQLGEIPCQFIILARKDELTPDLTRRSLGRSSRIPGNPVSVHHSQGNPVSVRGNPVSVHHSCPKRRTDTGFNAQKLREVIADTWSETQLIHASTAVHDVECSRTRSRS